MRKTLASLVITILLMFGVNTADAISNEGLVASKIIITELKVGGGDSPKEFVELYNASDLAVDVSGWTIEYLKSSSNINDCETYPWRTENTSDVRISELPVDTIIEPRGTLVAVISMNDNLAGSIRLVQPLTSGPVVHDMLGWGAGALCFESAPVMLIPQTQSIKRLFDLDGNAIDTDNNSLDFADTLQPPTPNTTPAPQDVDICSNIDGVQTEVPEGMEYDSATMQCKEPTPEVNECDELVGMIQLSEILPNPEGSDTGNEFIELENISDEPIVLDGCWLQVDDKEPFLLDGLTIESKKWLVISNSDYNFTLPNAAGGAIYVLSLNHEISNIEYPGGLDDSQVFALFNDEWKSSYSPSPGEKNVWQEFLPCDTGQERNAETGRCVAIVEVVENTLTPCAVNQFRNPETNRCKLLASTTSSLVACAENQYRNPETNRCRLVASTTTALTSCAENQFRNPETNRCKLLASATSSLQPCAENQERNPDTNRCRKVTSASVPKAAFAVEPIAEAGEAFIGWWALGGVGMLAVGYAGWEWRRELGSAFTRTIGFFSGKGDGK